MWNWAFDILSHNGKALRALPLIERKDRLAELVSRRSRRCTEASR